MRKTRVLIVDDSALVRKLLTAILESDPSLEVVGSAPDPFVARDMIKAKNPDVLTLDVEMPRMDGITFLSNLMRLRPMPVVMVSTLTERGAAVTLDALDLGAVDFVSKPKTNVACSVDQIADEIVAKVKAAARAQVREKQTNVGPKRAVRRPPGYRTTDHIIAIGASTGGTNAIRDVLVQMPADAPGIVITQHIPGAFSRPFAERLDSECTITVVEAEDGQQIISGHAFVAPGGRHLEVRRSGARFLCRVHDEPPVNRHRPSVDVLFDSVATNLGENAIGALLTGMGADGAEGLGRMQAAGAPTVAQDEATSVVWGMPGAAVQRGYADYVVPLDDVAETLMTKGPAAAGRKGGKVRS